MLTAVISDLHIGSTRGIDVLRGPDSRRRLMEGLEHADRVVLLGDFLELREQPVARVLEVVAPLLDELGRVLAGRQLVIVPGNHDHRLAAPALERRRLEGSARDLEPEWITGLDGEGLFGVLQRRMPSVELQLAYPGIRLREDVYATHGHYLDCFLSVPRVEAVAASAMVRLVGGRRHELSCAADFEAALAPLYDFTYNLAQAASERALQRSGSVSRMVYEAASSDGGGRRRLPTLVLSGLAIPAGVTALNRIGLGPYRSVLSGQELRRAGLKAMGRVVEALGVEAEHVLFGHTHRAGPLEGESDGWTLPGGTRLWNCGAWIHESVLLGPHGRSGPYWPGTIVYIRDEGPPELSNVLR